MQYTVDKESLSGVLTLSREKVWGAEQFDLPDELVARYDAARKEFFAVQKVLREHTGIKDDDY